jgi:hypothetical protein
MSSVVVSIVTGRRWAPRADPRHVVDAIGNLTSGAGKGVGCLVEDVSHGGAKVCTAEHFLVGEQLRLSIPEFGFVAPVTVVWATLESAGLAFGKGVGPAFAISPARR